jgi:hypothetical protein
LDDCEDSAQLCLFLYEAVLTGAKSSKSMRFMDYVQDCPITILLDSRGSHSFLSTAVANRLSGVSTLDCCFNVKDANGVVVRCVSQLKNACWEIRGRQF